MGCFFMPILSIATCLIPAFLIASVLAINALYLLQTKHELSEKLLGY